MSAYGAFNFTDVFWRKLGFHNIRREQNGGSFTEDIFKSISVHGNYCLYLITISTEQTRFRSVNNLWAFDEFAHIDNLIVYPHSMIVLRYHWLVYFDLILFYFLVFYLEHYSYEYYSY